MIRTPINRGGRGPPPTRNYDNYPSFNTKEYLDSLPDTITKLDLADKGITYIPDLSRFKKLKKIDCSYNKLTKLPKLNNSLIELDCTFNQLTELPELNNKLTSLMCGNNNIIKIPILNNKLTSLKCGYNKLTKLPKLNEKLLDLECHHNNLTELPELNEKLLRLVCACNNITKLPNLNKELNFLGCSSTPIEYLPKLNDNLEYIYCESTYLSIIPILNEKIKIFEFMFTPISDIIFNIVLNIDYETYYDEYGNCQPNTSIDITKEKIQRINKFRHLYYSLKYREKFRDWLWKKIREPKIKKHYHPNNLFDFWSY